MIRARDWDWSRLGSWRKQTIKDMSITLVAVTVSPTNLPELKKKKKEEIGEWSYLQDNLD